MGRHGEKKFTTWEYRDHEVVLQVPVTLVDNSKKGHIRYGEDANKTFFEVHMDEPEIREKDTDINRLRETVFAQIKAKLAVEWKSMLLVEVSASHSRLFDKGKSPDTPDTEDDAGAKLVVNWERWQVAKYKGKKISRRFNNYHKPWRIHDEKEKPAREVWNQAQSGWPDDKDDRFSTQDQMPEIKALIPDTPANRVALEAITDAIENLYHNLAKLLASDKIEETLAAVASKLVLNLAGPVEGSKPKGSKGRGQK